MNEDDNNLEPFVIGPHNVGKVFKAVRRFAQKTDVEVATAGEIRIHKCRVCQIAMLTQPAAMILTETGPEYFCEQHIPE